MHWFLESSGLGPAVAQTWPLVDDPRLVFAILAMYYVVILGGKRIMMNKKPFELFWYSQIHNICMVAISAYMTIDFATQFYWRGYKFFNNPCDPSENGIGMARAIYIFYLSKIPEWNDTLIMILKKNFRHVSFLHLYHHGSIFIVCWLGVRHVP